MGIFGGGGQKPTRLNQIQFNDSVRGYAVPVAMGKVRMKQSIVWGDGLKATQESSGGGKGIGGGKGGSYYLYTADMIGVLCNGQISGIGDVWQGSSWLSHSNTSETVVLSSTTYTPTNASSPEFLDMGVSTPISYSGTYNDYGAPSSTSLSGTDYLPLVLLPYGSTLTSGTYSVNPTGNVYNFSAADNGKTVILSYSFAVNIIKNQESDIIPSSKNIQVGGTYTFSEDDGVVWNDPALGNFGQALTKDSGSGFPSTSGHYTVSGSAPATYKFAAADINKLIKITFKIQNNSVVPKGASSTLNFQVAEGTLGQSTWSTLTTSFPGAAIGYSGLANVLYAPMQMGMSPDPQQNTFEVQTPDAYGGGIVDCNPVQCIYQVLTNKQWGLGSGLVPFPVQCIDNGSSGTWGSAVAGTRQVNGTAWSWFAANNFFISPVIESQDSAASVMNRWVEAGACTAFYSEGLLKLVPYGDTSCAANGMTWTAPTSYVVALDDTIFLSKEGEEKVKINRTPGEDAWNKVQVQWNNRSSQYAPEITQEWDQAAIDTYTERTEDSQNWDFIHTLPAATFAGNMRVKRSVYIRRTFKFSLPSIYSYLEPMDLVTISTTSGWDAGRNNVNLGITNLPVRITKIVDNPGEEGLQIEAEDYPWGVHQPVLYNKGVSAADVQQNMFADPGNSEVVMFEATARLTNQVGNTIGIGVCGTDANWGGCNVLVSQDGTKYRPVMTIKSAARLGTLNSTFASGSDPDATNSLVVNLAENSAALESGTTTDADSNNTLCFVDGELISYSTCVTSGQDQYTMSGYIRRGVMGSTVSSHAIDTLFLRLDDAVQYFQYDPAWSGQTLYFKFQSFNVWNQSTQDESALTPVTFTIPGKNPGSIDASSGLPLAADWTVGAGRLGWTPASTSA